MFRNNSDLLFVSLFFPLSSGYSPIFAVIREYDRSTESEDGQMPNQETLQVVEIIRHPNYSSKYSHDVSSRPASKLSLQILSTVQVSSTTLLLYFYLAIPLIGILLNFFFSIRTSRRSHIRRDIERRGSLEAREGRHVGSIRPANLPGCTGAQHRRDRGHRHRLGHPYLRYRYQISASLLSLFNS